MKIIYIVLIQSSSKAFWTLWSTWIEKDIARNYTLCYKLNNSDQVLSQKDDPYACSC